MGLVALAEAEGGGQVRGKKVDLLDVGDQGLVDRLLVRGPGAANLLLLSEGRELSALLMRLERCRDI